jgi:hypothetical protein
MIKGTIFIYLHYGTYPTRFVFILHVYHVSQKLDIDDDTYPDKMEATIVYSTFQIYPLLHRFQYDAYKQIRCFYFPCSHINMLHRNKFDVYVS